MVSAQSGQAHYGIAIFHAAGDILNCTSILRQLKTDDPNCRITWFTAERYRMVLEHNPLIDELVVWEGDPLELDARIPELRGARAWTRFIDPAPYRNYDKVPGGSLIELIRAAAGLRWTVPFEPVFRLTEEEWEVARTYWEGLPPGPKILVETEYLSSQSFWDARSAEQMRVALASLDPCFVFTAKNAPSYFEAFRRVHPKTVWCRKPFRLNAAFYNLCDAFIGVSSGISVLSLTDACRRDVPSIECVRGEHWSAAPAGRHVERIYCFSERRFLHALETLRARLMGEILPPEFSREGPVLPLAEGKERIVCPSCGASVSEPVRGKDIVQCQGCGLVYLQDRPTPERLQAYYAKTYAVGDPSAAPAVRVPPDRSAVEVDPGWLEARRAPMVEEALCHVGGPPQGRRIVDVGCGWGALLHGARLRGMEVTGFEFTEPNVRFGRDVLKLDIRSQAFPEGDLPEASVDVVTFSHSLEHVPDPMAYLEKAAHVLKPGGILSVVVPNIESLGSTAMGEGWPWLERDWHYVHFSPATLRALVLQCGFHVEACYTESGDMGRELPLNLLRRIAPEATEAELTEKLALLESRGKGEEIHLVARKLGPFKGRLRSPKAPQVPSGPSILWIRTDAIGDALLASSMLPRLLDRHPGARMTVVCREAIRPLYEACPHVADVIGYDRTRAYNDEGYRKDVSEQIRAVKAELCLNSVFSREAVGDLWAAASGAPRRVGCAGDCHNMTEAQHRNLDPVYTELVPAAEGFLSELDRHQAFLEALGCEAQGLQPLIWTTEDDECVAETLFRNHGLDSQKTLALFAGAQFDPRIYDGYGRALRGLCAASGFRVIALGSSDDSALNQSQLDALGQGHLNLSGELTLRQCAAVLRRCRMAVGAETGLAHMACAVGIPHVVVLGGGHFGRFMPYSPWTSAAVLPLDCFLCDWNCVHRRAHCVKDLAPQVLQEAVLQTLERPSTKPRLFVQDGWIAPEGGPHAIDLAAAVDAALVTVIPVKVEAPSAATIAVAETGLPRTTVFCGVWHKDPKRMELLRGHQDCLDGQTVPVDRVYVFDGADTPPSWLKGKVVTAREALGLYEAWNVALGFVRTPYVMNLNLDDRLNPDAVAVYERVLDGGADLVGGEWRICFSQEETDAVEHCVEASAVPFYPDWPPVPGRPVRLGSGTGERGTLGPACAWRMAIHAELPKYPWQFQDGTPIRIIGDSVWWRLLDQRGKVLKRVPIMVGRYHSHPGEQAEFRNPAAGEESKLTEMGLALF